MGYITDILKKPIVKISSLNGVSVLIRIFGGLITSKAIAAYIGAEGMALVGSLRNFLTSVEYFSTLGMQNGIVKYTAENNNDDKKLYGVLSTVFITILGSSLFMALLLFAFSGYFTTWIFGDLEEYKWVVKVLALSLPWFAGSFVFMAVLNGLGNYKQVIWLNIAGNVTGVGLSVVLMWKFHIQGAMLGLILFQVFVYIVSFYAIWQRFPGLAFFKVSYFDRALLKSLLSYSMMTLVSALLIPVVYIAIRNNIINNFSLNTAGYWDAINRLSTFYMMFATTMVSIYFLPKLSTAQSITETKKVFRNYYKSMMPLFLIGLTVLYLLRRFVVLVIFKEEFLPMTELFLWQLLGDFFKVGSLVLGYQFFAKKLTRAYIITELFSFGLLYFSSLILIKDYGAEGAVMAHALTFFVYWIVLAIYFRKELF